MNPLPKTSPHPPDPPPSEGVDLTGRTVGDFRVLRRLGQGGMGQVYLAEQVSLKRKVALKILRADLAADPSALQRFQAEAEAVAQATHANIVQVYFTGQADGLSYMALEYVEGRNLGEYLVKKGPPDILLALSIMRQVASALQRASELGIIHRDIKPENILLTRKGEVKVADFGLSRCLAGDKPAVNLTQSGVTMGTPLYMSPEQVEGQPVDARTDIYSFGVTCYHMLAGHPPFRGESPFEVALQHVRAEPEPLSAVRPDLPPGLCAIVHKMLAKDPAQRFQTGSELLKEVGRLRQNLGGQTGTIEALSASVELVPMSLPPGDDSGVRGTNTHLSTPEKRPSGAATQLAALSGSMRRRARLLLFVASMLLAAGAGVGIAWYRHNAAFPLPGSPTPATEEADTARLQKRGQAMREVIEQQYLEARPGGKDVDIGLNLCLKLGVFYLENDRLDEALGFFSRLDRQPTSYPYRLFGQVGRAIVLGLQSQAKESNRLFHEVFVRRTDALAKPRQDALLKTMKQNPEWRAWMCKAIFYNLQNGIDRKEVPHELLRLLDR